MFDRIARAPQGSILRPTLCLVYINDLRGNAICIIAIYAADLWQQLELASELESDLRDTVDWGKEWLVDFNAAKTQLVLFDQSINNGSIDVKMDGSFLEEKSSLRCWS